MTPQTDAYWKKRIKAEQAHMKKATDPGWTRKFFQTALTDINRKITEEQDHLGSTAPLTQHEIGAYEIEAKNVVRQAKLIRQHLGRNAKRADFDAAVNQRMKIYNATMRINRLEYLKSSMALDLVKAGIQLNSGLHTHLTDSYVAELKRQAGILGENLWTPSQTFIFKQIQGQVKGATFSPRVWKNVDVLKAQLDVILTNGITQGQSAETIARKLTGQVNDLLGNQARYVTERLARTEATRTIGQAQLDSFEHYGYKWTKWIAEASACDFCEDIAHGGKDGEGIYKLDEVPLYPRHPNCRCSLAAYYEGS